MRISDWSSDVCSSDLLIGGGDLAHGIGGCKAGASQLVVKTAETANVRAAQRGRELAGEATQRKHANLRSEEHTSELQSLMRISYAVFCLKKKNKKTQHQLQDRD